MGMFFGDPVPEAAAEISLFLDNEAAPFAVYRPPATCVLDTTTLADGDHVLRIEARGSAGPTGVRTIPFTVQNGPGITVTGLRANERVNGTIELALNAFGNQEDFDPVRAESSGPIPVWTWVMITIIAAWAGWYALSQFSEPASFAQSDSANTVAAANKPMQSSTVPAPSGKGVAAGFDYAATGGNLYTANCAACHGASGAGIPATFPALAKDPVVLAADPHDHIAIVLHGLHGKSIGGTAYQSQMPAFPQLSDNDIAAIVDHERTSWGNLAPIVTPDDVRRAR